MACRARRAARAMQPPPFRRTHARRARHPPARGGRASACVLTAPRALDVDARPARFVADALTLPAGSLGGLPSDLAADLLVQDEASQIVAHAVAATPGMRVLDLCAAPGAKT